MQLNLSTENRIYKPHGKHNPIADKQKMKRKESKHTTKETHVQVEENNRRKNRDSIDAEKIFDKIQHPFMRTLNKVAIERTYLNIINTTANIIPKKVKGFPLKSKTQQQCQLLPLLFKLILEILAREISQEKG